MSPRNVNYGDLESLSLLFSALCPYFPLPCLVTYLAHLGSLVIGVCQDIGGGDSIGRPYKPEGSQGSEGFSHLIGIAWGRSWFHIFVVISTSVGLGTQTVNMGFRQIIRG